MKQILIAGLFMLTQMACAAGPQLVHNPFRVTPTATHLASTLIALHHLPPEIALKIIRDKNNHFLSAAGVAVMQKQQRRIWIEDRQINISKIKQLLNALDTPAHQVLLKARIVSIDDTYARDLGLLFQTSAKSATKTLTGIGSFAVPIANLGNGILLDAKLEALEKNGHAKVISSPEIVTLDHQQAMIEAGEEVPYQQKTYNNGTSVAFKKAVLRLQVTPNILANQRVLLDLHINQDKVSALTVQGVPAIHTQQLQTQVELNNKQTFMLGGIIEASSATQRQGIPYLQNIPVLGYLFRTHHKGHGRRELLIFITPDILALEKLG